MTRLMTIPVSALIITKNEAQNIERCLNSLLWADEIVVIDAFSDDRTAEICLNSQAPWAGKLQFKQKSWEGFRVQRNFSLDSAKNNWVFIIDADEKCTPELAAKIKVILNEDGGPKYNAYKVHRVEFFLGKPIHYGIWNPSYQDRFFDRTGVRYVNDIHEYPVFREPPGMIHEAILHDPGFAPERFLEKMNRYTTIEARNRVEQGRRTNLFRLLGAFPAMFLKNYFYYSAYRDGLHGVVISLLEGISRAVRHIKMWQIQRELSSK